MEQKAADLAFLKIVSGNSNAMMKVFITSFLSSAQPCLDDLESALAQKDYAMLKKVAHTYKPQVSYMGLKEITPVLEQLETDAASQVNTELYEEKVMRIKEVSLKAIAELSEELKKL